MPDPSLQELQEVVQHRYNVEGLLGRGGMGAVYRARHVSLDAPVAIKLLPIPASIGAEELARFRREAMLAARLPNPHIVPVYEFEIRGDIAYLVMPLVDGVSLAQRLEQEGPLSLREVCGLVEQIGGALAFAHERGIIHRDVKPANILWEPANRRWLITDFGIARHAQPGADAITSVGAVLGTPAYMAPEQAAGLELDGRTDMYALATTACEALTGQRLKPLAGRDTAVRALQGSASPVPPKVAAALTAPLAPSPDERPADMRTWVAQVVHPGRRPWWRSVTALGATAGLVTAVGIAWLAATMGSPASRPAGSPVVAVLPFTDGTARQLGGGLAAMFEDELRWVSGLEVVPAAAVAGALANAGLPPAGAPDSAMVAALRRFRVTGMLAGTLEDEGPTGLRLRAYLRNTDGTTVTAAPHIGPPDSLRALIAAAALDLFHTTDDQGGYRAALPAGGLAAWSAMLAGDSLFRSAAYDAAIVQYERVLTLDSTYALAAFKRMLAEVLRIQPTRASRAVRAALDPVRRYRDNLDPMNRELLTAYELLVTEGDVEATHERLRDLTDRYPLSVDAWFVRGYLELYFGPLFGTAPSSARGALGKAAALDPGFAVVHLLLGWIAMDEGDLEGARAQWRQYLAHDSTSNLAELTRLADSLRLRGDRAALAALRRLEDRPVVALEMLAFAGKAIELNPGERVLVADIGRVLRDRATTAEERAIAFRLQLGNALGAGRTATVDTLFREAVRRNVPREELDHATVLLAVTGLPRPPLSAEEIAAAAGRLAADTSHPDGPWLAARWFRTRDAARARAARQVVQRIERRGGAYGLLARGLLTDLEALDRLDGRDTLGAFQQWAEATRRYQFEDVPFGLVASLWPVRLAWAEAAAAHGDAQEVLRATTTFEQSPGFMDQAGRLIALPLRADALDATGDVLAARELRRRFAEALRDGTGTAAALRDSLLARTGGS